MNIIQHSHISVRKFGGHYQDYVHVHRFIDSSKLYYHHLKHRCLLHNTYGVGLAVEIFGDGIENSSGKAVSVRDIAIAHIKEDHSGKVPTLRDWFGNSEAMEALSIDVPETSNEAVKSFILRPYFQSGITATMFIPLSELGVEICEQVLGLDAALELRSLIPPQTDFRRTLESLELEQRWQFTPCRKELDWLRKNDL